MSEMKLGKYSAETRARHGLAALASAIVSMIAAMLIGAVPAMAAQVVHVDAPCSITFTECQAQGQEFHAYRVASMNSDGTLAAVDALQPAVAETGMDPASISSQTDAATLRTYATTYAGYVAANPSGFEGGSATASGGSAAITGLKPGLYLLVADTTTVGDVTYTSSPYLIAVPEMNSDGTYMYERTVVANKVTPSKAKKYENRIVKLWKDPSASSRPAEVKVQIYDGSKLYQEVTLNAGNNWTYTWEGKGTWFVHEVYNSASGYRASVSATTNTVSSEGSGTADAQSTDTQTTVFQVTNTSTTPGGGTPSTHHSRTSVPKTGDASTWLIPVVLLCVGGASVLFGIVFGKRRNKDEEQE